LWKRNQGGKESGAKKNKGKEVSPPVAKSQQNGTTILLNLKGYQAGGVKEDSKGVTVHVRISEEEVGCPYCAGKRLCKHGACLPKRVLHGWNSGRKVYLELYRQRWRCRDCGHPFCDGVKLVRLHSRTTKQAEQEALWQLWDCTFGWMRLAWD
jgi:transposase